MNRVDESQALQSPRGITDMFRDEQHNAHFDRKGFLTLPCLSEAECEALRAAYAGLESATLRLGFSASVMSSDLRFREAVNLATTALFDRIIDELFVGYRLCFSNFVTKRAQNADVLKLHQDPTFVSEPAFESVNIWIPLEDVSPENGCLFVVPGSQRLNRAVRGTNRRFPYDELLPAIEANYVRAVPLKAGEACIMSQRTFHGSYGNAAKRDRISVAAIAVPSASIPIYCYQGRLSNGDAVVDVFQVDDEFYRTHVFGETPNASMLRIKRVAATADAVGLSDVHAAVSQAEQV